MVVTWDIFKGATCDEVKTSDTSQFSSLSWSLTLAWSNLCVNVTDCCFLFSYPDLLILCVFTALAVKLSSLCFLECEWLAGLMFGTHPLCLSHWYLSCSSELWVSCSHYWASHMVTQGLVYYSPGLGKSHNQCVLFLSKTQAARTVALWSWNWYQKNIRATWHLKWFG